MEHLINSILTRVLDPSLIGQREAEPDARKRRKLRRRSNKEKDRAADHASELSSAAEALNRHLKRSGSSYRFHILEQDGDLFLHLIILSQSGSVETEKKIIITDDDFSDWIDHIASAQGFLFDGSG